MLVGLSVWQHLPRRERYLLEDEDAVEQHGVPDGEVVVQDLGQVGEERVHRWSRPAIK